MPLLPISLTAPGRLGINLQERDHLLRPEWATKTENLVLSESGKLHCRGALNTVSTDGASSEVFRMFDYINASGTEVAISAQATKIVSGVADLEDASTDVTSSTTPTAGYWKFVNFNGKVLGWQKSHAPIVKTSGDFADIVASTGTLPDGDVALAAFGRVWAVDDDGQTVRYCALLDETKWATADGGGSVDMRNVWTQGMDVVTGMAAFGANLLIFGRRHIIVYSDGQGSAIGVDPTQMYVVDTIEGTGCVSRDTIQNIGEGDLIFLSESGVQSLRRLLQNKDNPLDTISWPIQDHLRSDIKRELDALSVASTDARGWTGTYVARTGQYFLVRNYTYKKSVYVFHMLLRTQDEKGREVVPITYWSQAPVSYMYDMIEMRDGTVYTNGTDTYEALEYRPDGVRDEDETAIEMDYEGGWISLEDPQSDAILKLLKAIQISVLNPAEINSSLTAKYGFDYVAELDTIASNTARTQRIVEIYDVTGDVDGQYIKVGATDADFGAKTLQQINLYLKPSRLAFIHDKDDQVVSGGEGGDSAGLVDRVVAVGATSTGRVAYTDDGATWTTVTSAVADATNWGGIAFAPELGTQGRFVAVGENEAGMYSDDGGLTWTANSTTGGGTLDWVSIDWSPELGLFVAVASNNAANGIAWSADGITWTAVDTTTQFGGAFLGVQVKWIPELDIFVLVGSHTAVGNRDLGYSTDGKNWTLVTAQFGTSAQAVAYSHTLGLVLVTEPGIGGGNDQNGLSPDGVNWSFITPTVSIQANCLAWSPQHRLFAALSEASTSQSYTSYNGTQWLAGGTIATFNATHLIWMPAFELFMACGGGTSSMMATSPNGKTWTVRTALDKNWAAMAAGKG